MSSNAITGLCRELSQYIVTFCFYNKFSTLIILYSTFFITQRESELHCIRGILEHADAEPWRRAGCQRGSCPIEAEADIHAAVE